MRFGLNVNCFNKERFFLVRLSVDVDKDQFLLQFNANRSQRTDS